MRTMNAMIGGILVAFALFAVAPPARADDAKSNYKTFCAKCHGDAGKGNGSGAATLATRPRNFTDCARMAKESDETLFKVIRNGGKANGMSDDMQAWNNELEDPEIKELVADIRTFCKK
jgi:high-affinity iron transporter